MSNLSDLYREFVKNSVVRQEPHILCNPMCVKTSRTANKMSRNWWTSIKTEDPPPRRAGPRGHQSANAASRV